MAGRSGQYYRAGHWVNRSAGGGRRRKPWTLAGVLGVAAVALFLVLIQPDQGSAGAPAAPVTTTPSAGPSVR